ncbi:replication initiation protein [Mycobacterium phage Xula]|uniref:Helix-turn-helix DNA binding domain protein n=1 Tax=Mycobacterium phage Xula TaxID=2599884 RepID=A0A5J6TMU8_9CAUD|nr:replication initiation protein [Mycobacterium phage Xula]QFG11129.1 helix-turn-helix DNA binding domain protein [Mycobacterium phage Xula]
MPWFNVDDGFANSKPVLRIPRRYRCQAIGLWTLAGSWSAKELTDGFIPDHTIEEFAGTPALAEHLVRAGLWTKVEGGWQFENWAKWQKTKAQVLTYRAADADRKRKARSRTKPAPDPTVTGLMEQVSDDLTGLMEQVSTCESGTRHMRDSDASGLKTAGQQGVSGMDSERTNTGVPCGVHAESETPLPIPLPTPEPTTKESGARSDSRHLQAVAHSAPAAPTAKASRGSRLPEGWMPDEATIAAMREQFPHVDLRAEHEKFTDYWRAAAGAKGRKADWTATWRNWIRRAAENAPRTSASAPAASNGLGKPSQKALGWEKAGEALIAELEGRR